MSIRDAELEFEVNDTYWLDDLDPIAWLDEADDDDWVVGDDDDDLFPYVDDAFADDFADWEIDLLDDEV